MNLYLNKTIFYDFYIESQPIQHFTNFEFSINIDMEVNQQKLIENSPRRIFSVHFIG